MNEIYPLWVAAHGIMVITPVNWYQAPGPLRAMMDRLVCADGGNPDPSSTRGKKADEAKALELAGCHTLVIWPVGCFRPLPMATRLEPRRCAGKKCLFFDRFFTTRIVGLHRNESDAILAMLFRHIETPELSLRFKWQPNSIAFWDNRCVQHHALWDYYPSKRYGHRVTICGDRPY